MERVDIFIASEKIKKVILSCKTEKHFIDAEMMMDNFHRVYNDDPDIGNCMYSLYIEFYKQKRISFDGTDLEYSKFIINQMLKEK